MPLGSNQSGDGDTRDRGGEANQNLTTPPATFRRYRFVDFARSQAGPPPNTPPAADLSQRHEPGDPISPIRTIGRNIDARQPLESRTPASRPSSPADRKRRRELAEAIAAAPAGLTPATASRTRPGVLRNVGQPITEPSDPRWVLALRTAEALQGSILPPEKRHALVRLGAVLGMTPFDANLIIAIVQDQARRGFDAAYCPTAGEAQLAMVPLPARRGAHTPTWLWVAAVVTAVVAVEVFIFKWVIG